LDCRASDDLVGVIGKDEVGECISLSFSDANPPTRLFGTARRKKGINRVEDRFKPAKLKKSLDVKTLPSQWLPQVE
jgi:hypothetical protein